MTHTLVRIIAYDPLDMGGDEVEYYDAGWHLTRMEYGDPSILCSGLVFGNDGVSGIKFESKEVKRGGITCPECLRLIKAYKAVKL